MELGLNKQNIKNFAWHLGVVAFTAAVLAISKELGFNNLDAKTIATFAVSSPLVKLVLETVKKD